nr:putative amino-acid permease p7g5.06 [Quercus suber]
MDPPGYHGEPTDYVKSPAYNDKTTSSTDVETGHNELTNDDGTHVYKKSLKGRHMQMIAIGGAIGAGLFVGSGSALQTGGPASLIICFMIIGVMLMLTVTALAELAVLYPVNGAFFTYCVRFVSRSWGFATGWDYAIQWLTILPFEITAASITIQFWQGGQDVNVGVWITVFLVALSAVQIFGVRGYGEVEFVLSIMKITAVTGFIILGIIINCGGVPTDNRGYIGGLYWSGGEWPAFRNGFKGFCSVFVTAAFAFGGTELTGLAAAEAADPMRSIPRATKQVFWRVTIFYIVSLLIVGLIVPADLPILNQAHGAYSKASPFVQAIQLAGIPVLPSIFNAVITISVLSVANSCSYGSTRTLQALAAEGMAPKFLAYIDGQGRPVWYVIALLIEVHLLTRDAALSGLADFFIWGSICFSHIRMRAGWVAQGRSIDDLPYQAFFGVWGSWVGLLLNMLCIAASFYVAVWPPGASPDAEAFFESFLAAPMILVLYLGWKLWTRDWVWFIRASDMDISTGMRGNLQELKAIRLEAESKKSYANLPLRIVRSLI